MNLINNAFRLLVIFLFLFSGILGRSQDNSALLSEISGTWKYVKHFAWNASKYNNEDIKMIMLSDLLIGKQKIFFKGPASELIEECSYKMMAFKGFFDREEKDPSAFEDRSMAIKYTKDELSRIKRIELDCPYNCLSVIYLKQDTLILNYCGGITFYFLKSAAGPNRGSTQSGLKSADDELNTVYKEIMAQYWNDTIFIKNARDAQRQWIKFRDAQVKMKFPPYPGWNRDSLQNCIDTYLTLLTNLRVQELKKWTEESLSESACKGSIR
jgi:uncharacterized protein YecT (DUF1311 family)